MDARRCLPSSRESGQTLPLIALFVVVLLAVCGMVVDVGNAYRVHQQLQASADAAAAAGASNLPSTTAALTAAKDFSSGNGGRNPIVGAGTVTVSATADCSTSPEFCNPANTVHVTQNADVPTTFLRVLGIDSIAETVKAQACSPCGGLPLDVMIVLDRSGSMSGNKLTLAKDGIKAFLGSMDPTVDSVGLAVLPPAANSASACAPSASGNYNLTDAAYLLVPLSNTYALSQGNLNASSPLVSTLNCVQAGGQTAYASAMDAAQAELDAHGRDGAQRVIIILSDGAANSGPSYLPNTSPYRTRPCGQAVNVANASKARGVLVYSVAYDISGAGADPCYAAQGARVGSRTAGSSDTPEQPAIQSNEALQQIASPGNYFAQPQPTQLTTIFLAISADIARGMSRING